MMWRLQRITAMVMCYCYFFYHYTWSLKCSVLILFLFCCRPIKALYIASRHKRSRVTCKRKVYHSALSNFLSFTSPSSRFLLPSASVLHSSQPTWKQWPMDSNQTSQWRLGHKQTLVSLLAVYETPTPLWALWLYYDLQGMWMIDVRMLLHGPLIKTEY